MAVSKKKSKTGTVPLKTVRRYLSNEETGGQPLKPSEEEVRAAETDSEAGSHSTPLPLPSSPDPEGVSGAAFDPGSMLTAETEPAANGGDDGPEQHDRAELVKLIRAGRYEIGNVIARGAESVLYEATVDGSIVCVKAIRNVFNKALGSSQTRDYEGKIDVSYRSKVKHLKNEFAVAQELSETDDFPVVRIYALRKVRSMGLEIGYDLVMERINGLDLANRQLMESLSLAQKVNCFYQTALSLAYLHQRRFIHLDMKPSNLMMESGRIRLIDFGVSVTHGFRPRTVRGTVGYLSPEQIVRDYLDEQTDVFALGVTFAVIFGGKPLRQNPDELKSRGLQMEAKFHLENLETPMINEPPQLTKMPHLAKLICRCTIPRRDKRVPNIASLISSLRRIAADYKIPLSERGHS